MTPYDEDADDLGPDEDPDPSDQDSSDDPEDSSIGLGYASPSPKANDGRGALKLFIAGIFLIAIATSGFFVGRPINGGMIANTLNLFVWIGAGVSVIGLCGLVLEAFSRWIDRDKWTG